LENTATQVIELTAVTTEILAPTSASGFDLDALLVEAQTFISQGNYIDAISTLDALVAIDPTFQRETVNGLLYNSLTQRASRLYQTEGGSLAEAILLTDRAAEYGDIANNG